MTQLDQTRTKRGGKRPIPDEAILDDPAATDGRATFLRVLGALAVLVTGAVHLEQYFAMHFDNVRIIGPLFALNFAGGTLMGLGLLTPFLRRMHPLMALAGIGLAGSSFVFLFISEHRTLFGFHEHGYRPAILIALVAEAAAVLLLGGYLVARLARR